MKTPYAPRKQEGMDERFLMRIADLLSNDPFLIAVLGENFKVLADYDGNKKFVRYLFVPATDADSHLEKHP